MTEAPRILIADDEQDLVLALRQALQDDGYQVLVAYDGLQALNLARRGRPDLIVLDVNMPELTGLEVCRRLRRDPRLLGVPILFLTVHSRIEERVAGLDLGSDDYVVKPFDLRELKARVRALLRRSEMNCPPKRTVPRHTPIRAGALTLDPRTHQLRVGDREVQLTPTELILLHVLMAHPGQIMSCGELLYSVWGYAQGGATDGLVRWHIKNLRAKIETDPTHPQYLCTLPRHGYVLRAG
jgi:DNA-binding response OmpR family regulator